jgi:flagellar basal body-associated protein FliL
VLLFPIVVLVVMVVVVLVAMMMVMVIEDNVLVVNNSAPFQPSATQFPVVDEYLPYYNKNKRWAYRVAKR